MNTLAQRLEAASTQDCRVVTGFDGFVDEMISVVKAVWRCLNRSRRVKVPVARKR